MQRGHSVVGALLKEKKTIPKSGVCVGTSVARWGQGGGAIAFFGVFSVHLEMCRYSKPTSMPLVPTKYLKYQQNIEIVVLECENSKNFLARSLRSLAYTYRFSQ